MSSPWSVVTLLGLAWLGLAAGQDASVLPVIVDVTAPARLRVGTPGEVRLRYLAPRGNVVAVIQAVEDLDGPVAPRSTHERAFGVVAAAFGREAGELGVPLTLRSPGRKRVSLTLVTDEREASESVVVHVEALP